MTVPGSTITGDVWNDLGRNGIQDTGEPGVAGAVVEVYFSSDATIGNSDDIFVGRAITAADGTYSIDGLSPGGSYYEIFRTPVGYGFTPQDVGGDDTKNSAAGSTGATAIFTFNGDPTDTTHDAGLVGAAPGFGFALSASDSSNDVGNSVATDSAGNVYVTGYFSATNDFDPGPGTYNLTARGLQDVFVAKYTPSGALVWAHSMGGANQTWGYGIAVAADGSVYTTGFFQSTVDFDPGPGTFNLTAASNDAFISKLDSQGNFVWARDLGGVNCYVVGSSIAVASDGSVYTTGAFNGTVDFDPGSSVFNLTSAGSTDVFVSKLNSAGNFVWARSMGGAAEDHANGIAVAPDGSVYSTGYFNGTADFDPGVGTFNLVSRRFLGYLRLQVELNRQLRLGAQCGWGKCRQRQRHRRGGR